MSSYNSRLTKLETAAGIGVRYGYMCVVMTGWAAGWDKEHEAGYKIQPYMQSAGGTGGEPFYLRTIDALREFAQRPDVNLRIYVIGDPEGSSDPIFTDPFFNPMDKAGE